jgi:membrane protease YdiL (CAAX protease family)
MAHVTEVVTRRASDRESSSRRPLIILAAVALPLGWIFLSTPLWTPLNDQPGVLATLFLGLVAPALVLTGRELGRTGVRRLFWDAVRPPRPLWWLPLAPVALPALVWLAAMPFGGARPITVDLLLDFAFKLAAGALIINIWEEMVWTGFVQRRAMARHGLIGGSLATAVLFAGIHLPLAFLGATSVGDVLVGVVILLASGVGLRLIIAGLDSWTGRSLLTVGLVHASFNTTPDLIDPAYDWVRYTVTVLLGLIAAAFAVRAARAESGARP